MGTEMMADAWDVVFSEGAELEKLARGISRVLGWTYFMCWSLSFYPQLIKNYRRKSVTGLSVDFLTINVLGFLFYTLYCTALLFSSTIRAQYAVRHPLSPEPTVRFNDLAFGVHAFLVSLFTWSQVWFYGYERAKSQRLSLVMAGVVVGCFTAVGVVAVLAVEREGWEWLDVVYTLSYAKLFITVVKYSPQALLNYRRKSTIGWSIHNILLDASGGILSLAQLFIDSSLNQDWSGVTGNPIKFGLGLISLVYDALFCVQHYVLYRGATEVYLGEEEGRGSEATLAVDSPGSSGYGSIGESSPRKGKGRSLDEERGLLEEDGGIGRSPR